MVHQHRNYFLVFLILLIFLIPQSIQTASIDESTLYFDIVVDNSRQRLYGANTDKNTVDVLSLNGFKLITTVQVGGEPRGMDMDPEGHELAVTLYSTGKIAFINLNTLTITSVLTPKGASPNRPLDIVYGRPGNAYSVGDADSGTDFVHVFDTDLGTESGTSTELVRAEPRIAIGSDENTLFVSEHFSPHLLYRYDISTDKIIRTHSSPHGPVNSAVIAASPNGKYVYTSLGQVWSADLATLVASLDISSEVADGIVDSDIGYAKATNRVFISIVEDTNVSHLFEFDGESFQKLRSYRFENLRIKAPRPNQAGTKIYISTEAGIKVFPANLEIAALLPAIGMNYCTDFYDDFSYPQSGWPVIDNANRRTEYFNGEYRVLSKQPGFLYLLHSPIRCEFEDYRVSVESHWNTYTGNSYGILFGIRGTFEKFYVFDVNTEQRLFRLLYFDGNIFNTTVSPTLFTGIASGAGTNYLTVEVQDSGATLFINGDVVQILADLPGLSVPTRTGISSSSHGNSATSDARYDNFTFVNLGPSTGLRQASEAANFLPLKLGNTFASKSWQLSLK